MLLESLSSIANLALLMALLIFIFSLVGMQFLNGDTKESFDQNDVPIRQNFNTFQSALITVFIILTNENWNGILAPYIYTYGWGVCIYFVLVIVIGNM